MGDIYAVVVHDFVLSDAWLSDRVLRTAPNTSTPQATTTTSAEKTVWPREWTTR